MAATATLTSAAGVLSLLDEPDDALKTHALTQLNTLVDHFWAEIATAVPAIECLYEDEAFAQRSLAAVVASKVFYHLEELDDALKYALGAGELFDVTLTTEYVETLVAKCIDEYIRLRVAQHEQENSRSPVSDEEKAAAVVDERLLAVVERMFQRCYDDGEYKQALGIAIESRRRDHIKRAICDSGDIAGMLAYCFRLTHTVVSNRDFRRQMLEDLVEMYRALPSPDYISMTQCLLFLDDHESVAKIVDTLVQQNVQAQTIMAYQVAFDLHENQNQPFLNRVFRALPGGETPAGTTTPADGTTDAADATATPAAEAMDTTETAGADAAAADADEDSYAGRLQKLKNILSGAIPVDLYLHFLYTHNKTDLNILTLIKQKLQPRNTVTHNAAVMAHAIMHAGTTVDTFLRDNLEWLSHAQHWAKYSATASIGVIHKGHYKESLKLLAPYLPQQGVAVSPYQEGGALYALGLIHNNHGLGVDAAGAAKDEHSKVEYLLNALRDAGPNEIVQHGACMGIGLTAMATSSQSVFEALKAVVSSESAVAGEAAGLAMGMVLLGSGNGIALEEMLGYATETSHEKIIRGLSLGCALVVYGREEESDTLVEQMVREKDPILRYGGMFAVALAYVGTSSNTAVRRLLHVAVSDVSDDVRRAAMISLGFVLCNQPEQVPRIVSQLADSYNPHVRYGAALACGVACAGTGCSGAITLLMKLVEDRVDFVRQGAFIALSLVVIQLNEATEPKTKKFKAAIDKVLASKGDTMTKLGAILASGIMNAGGRNCTISLLSPAGHKKMAAIVGMALFCQFWYWYPHVHLLSLAFTPTAIIGLNKDLRMPSNFAFTSNAKPSLFAYPPEVSLKKVEAEKIITKATLSVQSKKKQKELKASATPKGKKTANVIPSPQDKADSMDVVAEDGDDKAKKAGQDKENAGAAADKKKSGPEPTSEALSNPARVTWAQQHVLSFDATQRYVPVKRRLTAGVTMLQDTTPDEEEDIVVPKPIKIGVPGVDADEPEPPEPFEFTRYQ